MITRPTWHRVTRAQFESLQNSGQLVPGGRYDVLDMTDDTFAQYVAGRDGQAYRETAAPFEASIEESTLDVDLSAEGFTNTQMVDKYNPPGTLAADFRPGQSTIDEFNYDKGVQPQFYHDAPGSQFSTYEEDIKRFNRLFDQVENYSVGPSANKGKVTIKISPGLHRVWGAGVLSGLNAGVAIEGSGVFLTKIGSASFAASPRGNTWSRATINISAGSPALPEGIVVGMLYQSGEILSADTDHSASSATAIVNDDLAFLNTAHIIRSISADRMSFEVDVPHVGTSTTRLVGGNILNTGTGATGFPAGRITIPLSQIALTGGYDGRADEAWLRPQYGSLIEYADIGFVESSDPTITRSNGFAPDRKGIFAANIADVMLRQNVGFAGAEGHVLRIAKLVRLTANLSHFGGAGLNTRAGRSAYAQLVSWADFTRCSFGNSLTYSLLAAGLVTISAQNCVAIGGTFGVQAITGSQINYQNSLIYGAGTGVFAATNSAVTIDSGTVIENCGRSYQVRDTSKIVELSAPTIINCGAAIDNTTQNPQFSDDLVIDKVEPMVTFSHGSTDAMIKSVLGTLMLITDSTVRDITFETETTGEVFKMDMGAKHFEVDGDIVLRDLGAAIPDATADLASLTATVNAILATMRDARPSINT